MKDLTQGSEARLLIAFSVPMLIGNVFQQLYNMVDSVVVGNFVGKEALAAVGAAFPVLFLLISLFMGLAMGTNILIAQYFGARRLGRVKAAIETTYIYSFWGSLLLTAVGFFGAEPIMRLLQSPPDVLPQAVIYLQILSLGMLPSFGYNTVGAILRGLGDSRTPLYMLVASTVLNIGLDLLFVLAFGWGVAGVAWATVISQGLAFVGAVWWLDRKNELVRVNFLRLRFDREIFGLSLRIGLPSGIQQSLVSLGIATMTGLVNSFGTNAIAGYAAASRIESLASMPAMTISMALSTFVGQNLGAGLSHRVKRGLRAALAMGVGVSVLGAVVFAFGAGQLIGLFNPDPGVVAVGTSYLWIIGPFIMVFAAMFMFSGVLRGAGESIVPLVSTLVAMWAVRVPVAFVFSAWWGLNGVWLAWPTGWFVGLMVSWLYYRSGRWVRTFERMHARSNRGHGTGLDAGDAGPAADGAAAPGVAADAAIPGDGGAAGTGPVAEDR